jgi:cardiolipin synthase A/B
VLTDPQYFPQPALRGDSVVQILPTGPEQDASVLGQILFAAVSAAKSSVRIATPYFVPYAALRMALTYACYRGVRVQIVVPTRTDSPFVLWAGRSYYAEMIEAGVEIYEFDAGMLHSKIVTIDDRWSLLGSANMDVRSFRLNFEVTAIVYDKAVTGRLAAEIERHRAASRLVQPRDVWNKGLGPQLLEGAARLLAPLL